METSEPITDETWEGSNIIRLCVSIPYRIKKMNMKKCSALALAVLVFAFGHFQFRMMFVTMQSMIPAETVDHLTLTTPWFGRSVLEQKQPDNGSTGSEPTNNEAEEEEDVKVQEPLNILIVYPDDWRHDSLEDAKPSLIHTPFLSQLTRDGVRFTRNAVTSSICWISRATLFSGRYASQHRSLLLSCPVFTDFENWQHSWPYMLIKEKGYYVGHVGKWQFRNNNRFLRNNAFNWTRIHEGHHWYDYPNKTKIHAADRGTKDALAFLRERPMDRPFALTVAFYPPKAVGDKTEPGAQWSPKDHFYELYKDHQFVEPYNFSEAFQVLPPFLKNGMSKKRFNYRYSTHEHYVEGMKRYHALLSQVDRATEQIVEELKQQNVYNNTLIIITSDNGLMLGAHGLAGKWHAYEESIRVPLMIRDPRMPPSKRGSTDDSFTLNIDLAPTILGAAGIEPSPLMQGRDISDLYLAKGRKQKADPWRQDFFYEMPLKDFPDSSALVTKKWKYVLWPSRDNYEQLFDIENDPYELHDLLAENGTNADTNRKILDQLRARYQVLSDIATTPNDTEKARCKDREYGGVFETVAAS